MKEPTRATPRSGRALPSTQRRDTLIAIGAGLAMLVFVLYAIFYFSRQADSTGGIAGIIVSKEFVPRPETQITVGQGGLSRRAIAGEYSFRVQTGGENGPLYRVQVNAATYTSHQVGDTFFFLRPTGKM